LLSSVLYAPLLAAAQSGAGAWPQSGRQIAIQPEAWEIVQLANQERAATGAPPLQWDPALAIAARLHCLRMAAEGPISHKYPGEAELASRTSQAGAHFSLIEENVAIGPTPAAIHDEWMHSEGHRTNLLNPQVDRVGVAIVASRGVLYAVADYSRAVQSLSASQIESRIAGLIRVSGVAIVADPGTARAACAMDNGMPRSAVEPQPGFIMRWQDAELTRLPQPLVDRLESGNYRQAAIGSCPAQGNDGSFTAYRIAVLLY
jgi:hypothetical protein